MILFARRGGVSFSDSQGRRGISIVGDVTLAILNNSMIFEICDDNLLISNGF
jgi:hypothetical protein